MFELLIPYFIANALGIELDSRMVTSETFIVAEDAGSGDASERVPEDQTPSGKFTTAGEVKPILGMTKGNWVAVRNYEGQDLLYFTHLMSWRCGIWDVRYGLNGEEPNEVFPMEPCYEDTATPNSMMVTEGFLPYITFPSDSVTSVSVELTFDDGTTDTAQFERGTILIP